MFHRSRTAVERTNWYLSRYISSHFYLWLQCDILVWDGMNVEKYWNVVIINHYSLFCIHCHIQYWNGLTSSLFCKSKLYLSMSFYQTVFAVAISEWNRHHSTVIFGLKGRWRRLWRDRWIPECFWWSNEFSRAIEQKSPFASFGFCAFHSSVLLSFFEITNSFWICYKNVDSLNCLLI